MFASIVSLEREPALETVYTKGEARKVLNTRVAAHHTLNRATFIDASVWDELAERIARDFHAGDTLYVEGDLRSRVYRTDDGESLRHYILIKRMQPLGGLGG
jgi:single-stranded DNA-binding protein